VGMAAQNKTVVTIFKPLLIISVLLYADFSKSSLGREFLCHTQRHSYRQSPFPHCLSYSPTKQIVWPNLRTPRDLRENKQAIGVPEFLR